MNPNIWYYKTTMFELNKPCGFYVAILFFLQIRKVQWGIELTIKAIQSQEDKLSKY